MYTKLDARPDKIKAKEKSAGKVCSCSCKATQSKKAPHQPAANQTGTRLSVDYDING